MAESFQQLGFGLGLGILTVALGYSFYSANNRLGHFISRRTTLLLWITVAISAAFWWAVGALHYFAFKTNLWDEGLFTNILWMTLHGRILGTEMYNGSYLHNHFSPSLALLALLYAPWQHPVWLSCIRALTTTSGALGLYYMSKELGLPKKSGLLFALIWLGNIGLRGAMFSDFHEVTLVSGLLFWITYLAIRNKTLWVILLVLVSLGFKEDVPVYIGSLGLILALSYQRRMMGLILVLLAITYYLAIQLVVWNYISPLHADYFSRKMPFLASENMSPLQTILADPFILIRHLFKWDRLWGIIILFAPVLFLPFLRLGWLGLLLPLWLFLSVDNYDTMIFTVYYATCISALIIIASVPTYKKIQDKKSHSLKLINHGMLGLTIGIIFTVDPAILNSQFSPYNYLPHPYLSFIERMSSTTPPDVSLNTDSYIGSHFANREKIRSFPYFENWIADRIYISNKSLAHPVTLLAVSELGYKSLVYHPGFIFLSQSEGTDPRDVYLDRLRWMEAETATWNLWLMIPDYRASMGSAMLVPAGAEWGDRAVQTPRILLPPGSYNYRIRVAAKNDATNPPCLVFEVRFLTPEGVDECICNKLFGPEIWSQKIGYQTLSMPFKVEKWGLVYLNLNFGKAQDIRWDWVGIEGLPKSFDDYFKKVFPMTFLPEQGCLDSRLISQDNNSISKKVLWVGDSERGKVVCRWQINPNLPEGDYWLYYVNDSVDKIPLYLDWAILQNVQTHEGVEVRTALTSLTVKRINPEEERRIERSATKIHITPGSSIELVVNEDLPLKIYLDKMWLCCDAIIDPTVTAQ